MEHKNRKQEEYRFSIEYYIFREGDNLIAYCPSLDISTSGKDYGDAVKNFFERFQIYVETCLELGTLWDDLRDHGWKVTEKKLTPPAFSRLIRKPEMSKLLGGHINYEKVSTPMRIAAMAWRSYPVVFQTHVEPVPEFIVRNAIRDLGMSRNEFINKLEEM